VQFEWDILHYFSLDVCLPSNTVMAKTSIFLLGLLVWVGVEARDPFSDYQRMRDLGQNAKFGPNLLTHSKFIRHPKSSKEVFFFTALLSFDKIMICVIFYLKEEIWSSS